MSEPTNSRQSELVSATVIRYYNRWCHVKSSGLKRNRTINCFVFRSTILFTIHHAVRHEVTELIHCWATTRLTDGAAPYSYHHSRTTRQGLHNKLLSSIRTRSGESPLCRSNSAQYFLPHAVAEKKLSSKNAYLE